MQPKSFADLSAVQPYILPSRDHPFIVETEVIVDPNHSFYDLHYEFEVGVVLTGAMTRTYEGSSLDLGPGQVWMTGMWEPHGMRVSQIPCTLVIAYLRPDALALVDLGEKTDWAAPFLEFPVHRPRIEELRHRERLLALGRRIFEGRQEEGLHWGTYEVLAILELLALVQEGWAPQGTDPAALRTRHRSITPAMDLLFRQKTGATTDQAAAACALGTKTFARLFSDLMGTSWANYARAFRLRGAAHDLVHGAMPIKQIVEVWGFSDESSFTKVFARHFGRTPAIYRG